MNSRSPHFKFDGPEFTYDSGTSAVAATNLKAEQRFNRAYGAVADATWTELNGHILMCRFISNNMVHRAFYNPHGKWMYTVFGYEGSRLEKGIYDQVKSVYYNASIVYVNEITRPGSENIYVVELNDDKQISKLRVEGDDMEIIQQFLK